MVKFFILIVLLSISFISVGQSYDNFSLQELEELKKQAVENEDYKKAGLLKNEIERKLAQENFKDNLKKELDKAVAEERYLDAAEIKDKIIIFEAIDIKKINLQKAVELEQFEKAQTLKEQIANLENRLELPSETRREEEIKEEVLPIPVMAYMDTLYYNQDWYGVDDFENCTFYRLLKMDKENRIINPVMDYYKGGQLKGEMMAQYVDSDDDSKSVWSGLVKVYEENGSLSFSRDYSLEPSIIYKDGSAIQYFNTEGIIIAMSVDHSRQYGNYYKAFITLTNLTGKAILLDPDLIDVVYVDNDIKEYGKVLSHSEYMKKVNNRQAWAAALVAWGESTSASTAGYSSSTSYTNAYGQSSTYSSASGYATDGNRTVVGSASGYSTTNGSYHGSTTTANYDGAANYQAQQQASRNINNFTSQLYTVKKKLNQGYLKKNTVFNEQEIFGVVNIKYEKAETIYIRIPINGMTYSFSWNLK